MKVVQQRKLPEEGRGGGGKKKLGLWSPPILKRNRRTFEDEVIQKVIWGLVAFLETKIKKNNATIKDLKIR